MDLVHFFSYSYRIALELHSWSIIFSFILYACLPYILEVYHIFLHFSLCSSSSTAFLHFHIFFSDFSSVRLFFLEGKVPDLDRIRAGSVYTKKGFRIIFSTALELPDESWWSWAGVECLWSSFRVFANNVFFSLITWCGI